MLPTVSGATLLLACMLALLSFDGSAAQSSADPVDAAARHVLVGLPGYRDLSRRLLVDTAGYGYGDDTALSPAAQRVARRLAAEFGARSGRLVDVMVCREGPPPVDPFPQTCLFVDGVEAVLQVSDLADLEQGPAVRIMTWAFQEDTDRDTYHVDAMSRRVQLERTGDGSWKVLGVTEATHAIF